MISENTDESTKDNVRYRSTLWTDFGTIISKFTMIS